MRKIALAIIILLSFSFSGLEIHAEQFYTLDENSQATVTQIIDGDAFIATLIPSDKPVLVRMIGVDAEGYNQSVTYLNTTLLGETVRLVIDASYSYPSGRFNMAYVYKKDLLINNEILRTGNAKLNIYHEDASMYATLKQAADHASSRKIGIWGGNLTSIYNDYQYLGNGININTASSSLLAQHLNIRSSVADSIVSYRNSNPFSNIREIKFVPNFTKDMFDENREKIVVSTNINIAEESELSTLSTLSNTDVVHILDYRSRNTFNSINDLYDKSIISSSKLSKINPYISTETVFEIDVVTPSVTVNINTADLAQLKKAGLSESQAKKIIEYRSNYSYKSLRELSELFSFSETQINAFEDNLHLFTELNKATTKELESLLGDSVSSGLIDKIEKAKPFSSVDGLKNILTSQLYESIAPYVYVGENNTEYINVNRASRSELQSLGLSYNEASKVISAQSNMNTSKRLPQALYAYKDSISLYTNINTASQKELLSLSDLMTSDIVSQIITYRDSQPFGSINEVYEFFRGISQYEVYLNISKYIAVR